MYLFKSYSVDVPLQSLSSELLYGSTFLFGALQIYNSSFISSAQRTYTVHCRSRDTVSNTVEIEIPWIRWRFLVEEDRSLIALPRVIRGCVGLLGFVVFTGRGIVMEVLF